eukprot:scaffold468779_cov38-Prasinocladus_malaysianus.AAC.1
MTVRQSHRSPAHEPGTHISTRSPTCVSANNTTLILKLVLKAVLLSPLRLMMHLLHPVALRQ